MGSFGMPHGKLSLSLRAVGKQGAAAVFSTAPQSSVFLRLNLHPRIG